MDHYSTHFPNRRGRKLMIFNVRHLRAGRFALIAGLCFLSIRDAGAIGQSAVITLSFPVGGRPTALGEAFTALADDANAPFYNPAGLGQSPLAASWRTHYTDSAFSTIASRNSSSFGAREQVWAAGPSGILRFNGKLWETGEVYLLEGDESLRDIAEKYLASDNKSAVDIAIWEIQKANKLGMQKYEKVLEAIKSNLIDQSKVTSQFGSAEAFAQKLLFLSDDERTTEKLQEQLSSLGDKEKIPSVAKQLVSALDMEEESIEELTELTIPFTVAVRDSITAMAVDASDRLWVGTQSGLWRYHNSSWVKYTEEDGLPSKNIVSIAVATNGDVAVGTDKGLALNVNLEWKTYTKENGLPDDLITAVAFGAENQLYIGTNNGLIRKKGDELTLIDTTSGLLSQKVNALFYDSKGKLWVGGENGVAINTNGKSWRRYRFPNSSITCFAEHSSGSIWIGSNKGVITYSTGKVVTDKDGKPVEVPEWKTYHSKNALRSDNVRALASSSNDIWIATDKAVHQYDNAERQFLFFWEQLLPTFRMSELWHAFSSVIYPTEEWGTLGASINYINMGVNEWTDDLDRYVGRSRSWEGVFALSYGFPVKENLSLGLNVKFANSALAPTIGGVGQTFAIDAGVLKRDFLIDKFDIGFMLQNMGPEIYYMTPEEADPIPFTLRLGFAYRPIQTPFHDLTLVLDAYREVVKSYEDKGPDPFWTALWTDLLHDESNEKGEGLKNEIQEINVSMGLEYLYADFMALRTGFLGDYLGERFEWTMGIGVKYANLNFDFSYIYSPANFMGGIIGSINKEKDGSSGVRDGQWRLSYLMKF